MNSDLELATFIIHEATFVATVSEVRMAALRSGSDNTNKLI